MPAPLVAPPSKAYIEARRKAQAPALLSMERDYAAHTQFGLPIPCLLWPSTPCSKGCYCRSPISAAVSAHYPHGFGWYAVRVQHDPAKLDTIARRFDTYTFTAKTPPPSGKWVQGGAAQMIEAMLEATKVPGVFERVPEKLRGVFWLKGDGLGEELVVLHYGDYYPEHNQFLSAISPFSWGYPTGIPKDAPFGGKMYTPSGIEGNALGVHQDLGRDALTTPMSVAMAFDGPVKESSKTNTEICLFEGQPLVNAFNGGGNTYYEMRHSPGLKRDCLVCCSSPISQLFTLNELDADTSDPTQV